MTADEALVHRIDVSRVGGEVAGQEFAKGPFADEADPGRIAFVVVRQAFPARDIPHFALVEAAEREQRFRKLCLSEAVQEITLVFGSVFRLQQLIKAIALPNLRVVAGGDAIGPEFQRVIEERAKLDFGIAQNVGIRRAAGAILRQEIIENTFLVLGREVDGFDVDADPLGNGDGIDQVLAGGAMLVGVVVLPVLHEQPEDVVPLALQQERGDG